MPAPITPTHPIWTDAANCLPPDMRCVLATDMEMHFIACFDGDEWAEVYTEEPIDSVITHWMPLPQIPEE